MSKIPAKFEVVYEKVHGKPTFPVTGAFGGPSVEGGSIVAHVYVDHRSVPNISTHDVAKDGKVDLVGGTPIARGDLTREIQATLVFSPKAAVAFGEWLAKHGHQLLDKGE